MNTQDIINEVKNITAAIEDAKKTATQRGQQLFKNAVAALFDENPELESFSWKQFTPYFNDGDTCYFSVKEWSLEVNDLSEEDMYEYDLILQNTPESIAQIKTEIQELEEQIKKMPVSEFADYKSPGSQLRNKVSNLKSNLPDDESITKEEAQKKVNLFNSISELVFAFDEDMMLSLFGDHAQIIVTKDNIEVEHYHHE